MFEDGEYYAIFENIEEFYHLGYLRPDMGFSIAKVRISKDRGNEANTWVRVEPFEVLVIDGRKLANIMIADRKLIFKEPNDLLKSLFELCK